MTRAGRWMLLIGAGLHVAACNSGVPEPASVEIAAAHVRLTIVRVATDPFLSRHSLALTVNGTQGCTSSAELFPDTGHASRRNVYLTKNGTVYVIGQFDARVVEPEGCRITLSEFRHLDREVLFVGSFDEDGEHHWTYVPAFVRPELPFDKRM